VTLVRADNPGPMTLDGTNTWVLAVRDGVVVIDPGPLDEPHLQRVAAHGPVLVTVLTHHHHDHAEGAPRFHELTGAQVEARDPALCLGGGEPLWEGGESKAWPPLQVEVLHTPGHSADSVCLVVEGPDGRRVVFTGDTILGRGTTVVAHPDGNLAAYLHTLERLRDLGDIPVLPGHGPMLPSVRDIAQSYLDHRLSRLDQVRAALAAGDRSAPEVVRRVYADVDPVLWPAAEMSVRAQLDYVRERG
jgi:glyoxylase-like metal-dependent hydrolase (beta-lactamase superfamily II)